MTVVAVVAIVVALAFVAVLVVAVVTSCAIDPRAVAPTPDNPCGNIGVVCLDMQGGPSGMCCNDGETCGGGKYSVGCPAGECCDIRMPPTGVARNTEDAGLVWRDSPVVSIKHPQTRP